MIESTSDIRARPDFTFLTGVIKSWIARPWFAYLTIFLLQLKVVWGLWQFKDLTFGDTSGYFIFAQGWFKGFSVNYLWSPLYTAFYGSFLFLSRDVYWVTRAHRLVIVF